MPKLPSLEPQPLRTGHLTTTNASPSFSTQRSPPKESSQLLSDSPHLTLLIGSRPSEAVKSFFATESALVQSVNRSTVRVYPLIIIHTYKHRLGKVNLSPRLDPRTQQLKIPLLGLGKLKYSTTYWRMDQNPQPLSLSR